MQKWRRALYFTFVLFIGMTISGIAPVSGEPIELDGLIEPCLVINVGSGAAGILETIEVERGDTVKKGEVLATLQADVEKATSELARARASMNADITLKKERLAFNRRQKKRTEELYEKKAIPFTQMDEAETNRLLAELELKDAVENKRLAQLELKRSIAVVKRMTILSPIEGVVVERFLAPGEFVEDKPVLKIAQIHPLHVEVIVPFELLGAISVGTEAEVRPEEPVGGRYTAKVTVVDRVVDAASGTYGIRLELPNPEYQIPAGIKCMVYFP